MNQDVLNLHFASLLLPEDIRLVKYISLLNVLVPFITGDQSEEHAKMNSIDTRIS